jgi:hypothetical protein
VEQPFDHFHAAEAIVNTESDVGAIAIADEACNTKLRKTPRWFVAATQSRLRVAVCRWLPGERAERHRRPDPS